MDFVALVAIIGIFIGIFTVPATVILKLERKLTKICSQNTVPSDVINIESLKKKYCA